MSRDIVDDVPEKIKEPEKHYEDFDPHAPSLGSQSPRTILREVKATGTLVAGVLSGRDRGIDTEQYCKEVFGKIIADQNMCHDMTKAWMVKNNVPKEKVCPAGGANHRLAYKRLYSQFWSNETGERNVEYVMCQTCYDRSRGEVDGPLYGMGVPTQLLGATFDNWKVRSQEDEGALLTCRDYAKRPIGILILTGKVGLGKSHLAVAILRAVNKPLMMMATQTRLLWMLRATYKNNNAPNPVTLCARMKDLLVLDELGLTSGGKDEYGEIYDIVGRCYDYRTPLIVTTNVPISQFENAFGDRIADRLMTGKILTLTGTSWR